MLWAPPGKAGIDKRLEGSFNLGFAVRANFSNQSLGADQMNGCSDQKRLNPHVEQSGNC